MGAVAVARVGVCQPQGQLARPRTPARPSPLGGVWRLGVVEGELGARREWGERRKGGRRAARAHVAVPTLQSMLGMLGQLGVAGCGWTPGQGATVHNVVGVARGGRRNGLHVVAVVMVVRGRGLPTTRVAVLSMQGLDLGVPPSLGGGVWGRAPRSGGRHGGGVEWSRGDNGAGGFGALAPKQGAQE